MERYIIRNGEKITLTWDDEKLLHRQECISRANNDIENLAPWIDDLDEETLAKLGEALIEADMAENGDRAWNCMKEFGLNMDEPEE